MKKSSALFLTPSLLILVVLGLSSCSQSPTRSGSGTDIVLPTGTQKSAEQIRIQQLEASISQAQKRGNWPEYIGLNEQLWDQVVSENRHIVEDNVWTSLSNSSTTQVATNQIASTRDPKLSGWTVLLNDIAQLAGFKPKAAPVINQFDQKTGYQSELLKALKLRLQGQKPIKQVGVLLPFSGKYKSIGEQVRNGMLKAYMASDQKITLKFYDSGNVNQVLALYHRAKQEGADLVLGPLSKEAVDKLAGQNITDVIALNSSDNTSFRSFNYRTQSEGAQIAQQLRGSGFERIAILTSENSRDLKIAHSLKKEWLSGQKNHAVLSIYPSKDLNLRKALGDLINEEQSQARHNNLRWMLGRKLEFFPRPRKDLQAIVLIDKPEQVAVFYPQFAFYALDLPVYATSSLTPLNLKDIPVNRDLGNIIFPTIPAIFSQNSLNTELEAFGWDSFLLAQKIGTLAPNIFLTEGQSGILYLNGQEIDKKLIWAQYTPGGTLKRLDTAEGKTGKLSDQQRLENLIEKERLEALRKEMADQE